MLRDPIEVQATVLTNDPATARALKQQIKAIAREFGTAAEVAIWHPITARGLLGRIYRALRARVHVADMENT